MIKFIDEGINWADLDAEQKLVIAFLTRCARDLDPERVSKARRLANADEVMGFLGRAEVGWNIGHMEKLLEMEDGVLEAAMLRLVRRAMV